MKKRIVTGLAVLCLAAASPAAAAHFMSASFTGDFNDNPSWSGWDVQLEYDTELGTTSSGTNPFGEPSVDLVWDVADGTPSPLRALFVSVGPQSGVLGRDPPQPYAKWFTDFTHFEIHLTSTQYLFQLEGPGITQPYEPETGGPPVFVMSFSDYPLPNFALDLNASISTGFASVPNWYVVTCLMPGPTAACHPLVDRMSIGPGSAIIEVPEPATWTLLMVALGLIGCALRGRNQKRGAGPVTR